MMKVTEEAVNPMHITRISLYKKMSWHHMGYIQPIFSLLHKHTTWLICKSWYQQSRSFDTRLSRYDWLYVLQQSYLMHNKRILFPAGCPQDCLWHSVVVEGFFFYQRRCQLFSVGCSLSYTDQLQFTSVYLCLVFYGPDYYVQTCVGLETDFTSRDGGQVHADIMHPSMTTGPVRECVKYAYAWYVYFF